MKHLIVTTVIVLFLFSCQKEMNLSTSNYANSSNLFFQNVKEKLKDSLSADDYGSMDTTRLYKSKDAQSDGCFVRIGLLGKEMATDFILLKTDTLGHIRAGKIVHVDKDNLIANKTGFGGHFSIASLKRKNTIVKSIVNGKFKSVRSGTDLLEEEAPVGEQDLPDVVVTSYSTDGSFEGDWYCFNGFYDDFGGGGGGGSYTYGNSGGGGSGNNASTNNDKTIDIEIEPDDNDPIKVEDYIKCFSTIPDANATYKITLLSDIPVNGDPSKIFNWNTNSPGHSFIQLNKSNGNQSVQQNIGFYPQIGWKSLSDFSVDSKIVDNAGHEFNASLSLTINSSQFQAALNKIQAISGNDYNLTTWNCTDFALSVFNAASPRPLSIPQLVIPTSEYPMPATETFSNTPQGLYEEIQSLQSSHSTLYGTTDIPPICSHVGGSHGSCN